MAKKPAKEYTVADFRAELKKIMPGFKWTVHKSNVLDWIQATGIISSGFNRVATLQVVRRSNPVRTFYTVKIAGYGKHGLFIREDQGKTLAQALRALEKYCECEWCKWGGAVGNLRQGREGVNKC